jgi:hypothetical protein
VKATYTDSKEIKTTLEVEPTGAVANRHSALECVVTMGNTWYFLWPNVLAVVSKMLGEWS